MGSNDTGRYIFSIAGHIKEIIYPSKAIISFRYNGREEKAILLVHKVMVGSCYVDDHKLMTEVLTVGDLVEFDGHIYDKGGVGNSKDRCNYYAMKAWKVDSSQSKSQDSVQSNSKSSKACTISGTGWISEIFPRKGVLTFDNNGRDERVLFLASKLYIFEKRLGTKQSLDQVCVHCSLESEPRISSSPGRFCLWMIQSSSRLVPRTVQTILTTLPGSPRWCGRVEDQERQNLLIITIIILSLLGGGLWDQQVSPNWPHSLLNSCCRQQREYIHGGLL